MRTTKLKIFFIAIGLIFLSTSCTTLLYTSLDVLRPAKVNFDEDANDLLIVNNAAVQPPNFGHKTKNKNIIVRTDSVSIFCLGALTEDIESKNFFKSVQLIPKSQNIANDFNDPSTLSKALVNKLCIENHSNIILSLDKIKINDNLNEFNNEGEVSFTNPPTYIASLEVKVESHWSIHYLNKLAVEKVQFRDSLYWEFESINRTTALNNIPKRADALVDAALYAGHNSLNRFIPYWDKVDRYLYNSPNKLMKKGMDSVYVKNWKSAIYIWKTVYRSSNYNLLKAQSANNIAVAYEIVGDIDNAIIFALDSHYLLSFMTYPESKDLFRLKNYIEELKQRKNEIDILKKQIGN